MRGLDNILSDEELNTFVRVVHERGRARDVAIFLLLANTGIRPGEAVNIRGEDLRPAHGCILVKTLKRKGHVRDVDVPPALFARLELLDHTPSAPLFHQRGDGWEKPLTVRAVQHLWKQYARRAGIVGRSLYSLRHTYLTRVLEATGDPLAVRDLAGHARLASTDRYVKLRNRKKAAAKVPPVGLDEE